MLLKLLDEYRMSAEATEYLCLMWSLRSDVTDSACSHITVLESKNAFTTTQSLFRYDK